MPGIIVVDSEGRILARNRRFAELWGLAEKNLGGDSETSLVLRVLPKVADPDRFLGLILRLYDRPGGDSSDKVVLRDGRVLERRSLPLMGARGKPLGRLWTYRLDTRP